MLKSLRTTDENTITVTYIDGSSRDVPFFTNFLLGIKEPDERIITNITQRPRGTDGDSSYFINFSGGLGDCLMLLEVLIAFGCYLKREKRKFEFLLLIPEERFDFFMPLFKLLSLPFQFIISDSTTEEEMSQRASLPLVLLPSPLQDARVEHLSLGNFRDYVWAIWGIPEVFRQSDVSEVARSCFPALQSGVAENVSSNKMIIYSRGFGKANQWKMWPASYWYSLCLLFPEQTFVFYDADDELKNLLLNDAKLSLRVELKQHGPADDIQALVKTFSQSSMIISIDTGPAHLAGFFNVPCVVLWGPTNPIYYQHPNNVNLRLSSCPPCFYSQRTEICKSNDCMKSLRPQLIRNVIEKLLSGSLT